MMFKCKMIRAILALAVVGVACLCARLVSGQPTECGNNEKSQCEAGFYCELFHCRKCLSCEDLNREPPIIPSACIRSVVDCGPCIKGLVQESSALCVPEDARDEDALPAYVWAVVALGLLLLLAIVAVIIVYVLKNTDTFKILASTRTSVQSPCSRSNSNGATIASAPELPPPYDATTAPYNPLHVSERPASPPDTAENGDTAREDESSLPFMKRAGSARREGAREAAGRQAARVYSYPRYVRPPNAASYKSPALNEETESSFTVHDEDTMESTWTPSPSADHTDTNANPAGSTSLVPLPAQSVTPAVHAPAYAPHAPAYAPHAPHAPHASLASLAPHALCARQVGQDTNNNRNTNVPSVSSGPSFFINVMQNINAVQQHNDVTL